MAWIMSVFGTTMTAFALVGSTGEAFRDGITSAGLPLLNNALAPLEIRGHPVDLLGIRWTRSQDRMNADIAATAALRRPGEAELFPRDEHVHEDAVVAAVRYQLFEEARERGNPETMADVAIQNGGGLRSSIDAGEVTMGEVLSVLPFQNTLSTFEVTGEQIIELHRARRDLGDLEEHVELANLLFELLLGLQELDVLADDGEEQARVLDVDGRLFAHGHQQGDLVCAGQYTKRLNCRSAPGRSVVHGQSHHQWSGGSCVALGQRRDQRRVEPARQQHRVNVLDHVHRTQQIRFARRQQGATGGLPRGGRQPQAGLRSV